MNIGKTEPVDRSSACSNPRESENLRNDIGCGHAVSAGCRGGECDQNYLVVSLHDVAPSTQPVVDKLFPS